MPPTFVVGDVHGHVDPLRALLRDAGLVDAGGGWRGADAGLWFLGDLVDRGPDGIGAVELVMRLQREHAGVGCLLGNHEAALVAAARYPDVGARAGGVTFEAAWQANGGVRGDLERLRPEHVAWIEGLPAVARCGGWLLVHSDTDRYLEYGGGVDAIADSISRIVAGGDTEALGRLLDDLADRGAFRDPGRLARLLEQTGSERLVHGHTPIWYAAGARAEAVVEPLAYADGRAVNVDHGLYAGGSGFVWELR